MSTHTIGHNRPVSNALHPHVYRAMVGLAAILILSIWAFAGAGGTDLLLAVITAFIAFTVLIPSTLWWTRHRHRLPDAEFRDESLDGWLHEEFQTWQGRLSGRDAATQVLLPLTAVAFGMAIFAIVAHLLA